MLIEAIRDAIQHGQTHTILGPPAMVEVLRTDPDQRADMRAILESGRARLLQYEDDVNLPVIQIGDGSVALCSGDYRAMVETTDVEIYDSATSYVDSLRAEATPVPAQTLAEKSPVGNVED